MNTDTKSQTPAEFLSSIGFAQVPESDLEDTGADESWMNSTTLAEASRVGVLWTCSEDGVVVGCLAHPAAFPFTKTSPTRAQQAFNALETSRERLANATLAGASSMNELQHSLFHVASAEAFFHLESLAEKRSVKMGVPVDRARKGVARHTLRALLEHGADDGWSGRGNELKRVQFDAKREWVVDVLEGEL